MIKIEKMTNAHFENFRAVSIHNYAEALSESKTISIEKTVCISENEFDSWLPKGLDSDHMVVNNLLLGDKIVGFLWYGINKITAYIYDISIDKSHRNKGYGAEVLMKLQNELKKQHAEFIGLNVFSHNQKAIDFYTKLNFETECLVMIKKLT